jgi:putative DNA primase/helicase
LVSEVLTNIEFDTHASQWWEYDGKGKWNPVKDARIFKLSKDYLREVLTPFSAHYLNECITYARADVQVDGWAEADNLRYIPFTNGVLDLKGNQFLEHSPQYRLTWQLPRAYSRSAGEWSHIDRFLDTLANNDPGLKKLALAFCNAVLKGRSDLHKSLYLFGSGANGKGAYITLLEMLIGKENIHSTSMGELNTNRFEPANIRGKRLVMLPDEDKYGGGLNVFKAATGGNPVKFERKGENASTFLFQGMVVIAANKPTFLGNGDGGMNRRIVSFPCKSVIAAKDRRDMSPLFDADLTAFTSYLLALDDGWVADTIHNAGTISAVKELATELAIRGNSVAAFYHAKLEPTPDGRCGCGSLYVAYKEYCQESGVSAKGLNNFTPDLIEYCNTSQGLAVVKVKGREGNYLQGIQDISG